VGVSVVAQRAETPPPPGTLVSGIIPQLADPYFQRPETGAGLASGLFPGQAVVLTPGAETEVAPAAQGGTGKTQQAAEFARALWSARAVDVLVWVTASTREAVIAGYAQAAGAVGASDPDADADAAAGRLVAWLARTERRWALVLDDLADPADLEGLWPSGRGGRVVITTRLPGAAFGGAAPSGAAPNGAAPGSRAASGATTGSAAPGGGTLGGGAVSSGAVSSGAHAAAGGLRIVPVGGFSRREALSYLSAGLADYTDQRIEALDLGKDLDGLPIALAQAAAVINANRLSCQEYRARLNERREHMSGRPVDGVSPAVLATWSLAAECADQIAPAGLAWPALALAAVLDPDGIPGAVLTSPAACGFIVGRPSGATGADQTTARAAITNLARAGLVSIDAANPVRTVRIHSSVQTAVRAYLPPADTDQVVVAAADALVQVWPEPGSGRSGGPDLEQALRDSALRLCLPHGLRAATGGGRPAAGDTPPGAPPGLEAGPDALWQPEAHPLLFRLGRSLEDSRLSDAAMAYWQAMVSAATRRLGPLHADSLAAKDRLAVAYESAGRAGDAIAMFASALGDRERSQGPDHPDTIAARGRLAHAYASAGLPAEAVALYERMAADAGRQLGLGHPVALAARAGLADAYSAAGRDGQALAAYRVVSTDSERLLGPRHPNTLAARDNLAAAFLANGQATEAIDRYKGLLADYETMSGPDHPDTITVRANLASAYRRGERHKDAIAQYRRVLEDRERIAGADHPDAIAARANLAFAYRSAGQQREAIREYERTLADRDRLAGPDHADTRIARRNLAAAYQQADRLAEAVAQYEHALADSERMLGPGDLETLTTRASLAAALYAGGRLMEVIAVLQRALADSERHLGPDHPMTRTVRDNLETATQT
jgi:tetratricopeptide (TPR) repeat protein